MLWRRGSERERRGSVLIRTDDDDGSTCLLVLTFYVPVCQRLVYTFSPCLWRGLGTSTGVCVPLQ